MDSQINEQSVDDLINAMYQNEMETFDATFDIMRNEVVPSITTALESLNRALEEYQNAQSIRQSRLNTIQENADKINFTYFSPLCKNIQYKINKYYMFLNEEIERLSLLLNEANTSSQNMLTFQGVWDSYEKELSRCIQGVNPNNNPNRNPQNMNRNLNNDRNEMNQNQQDMNRNLNTNRNEMNQNQQDMNRNLNTNRNEINQNQQDMNRNLNNDRNEMNQNQQDMNRNLNNNRNEMNPNQQDMNRNQQNNNRNGVRSTPGNQQNNQFPRNFRMPR
ncbi:hypothetical protein [Anaerosporobacter faecicola]|uniref:hypothetical protein n=1 Tax=Anaerosporobacter faecicola TaxID=2718714 RepID=UPI00143BF780|nr:hypothetical protein [Anaerosporobacter faecicola]